MAPQVAAHLLAGRTGRPIDLGDTLVLIPTAGAGRAIRRELSKHGVLSPQFRLPMDALVPSGLAVASRLEREAAWVHLLDPAKQKTFASLIPPVVPLDTPDDRFGVAARLCNVCDQLAEAGLDPASPSLPKQLTEDAQRWEAFGKLYAEYLKLLSKHGLRDPNDVRLEQAKSPAATEDLKRVVVACIPDLAPVVETYLQSLEKKGIAIDVLAWSPQGQAKHLDAMGRPKKEWTEGGLLRVEQDTILPANDPPTEAGFLLDYVGAQADADFEVFAAAPESAVALAQEITWRDAESYLPEGRGLAQTESAEILLGWDAFAATRRLRDLRVLLQKPAFLAFFVAEAGKAEKFRANDALESCDLLIGQRLCENIPSARSWLQHAERPSNKGALRAFIAQEDLVRTAESLLARKLDGRGMLSAVNEHRGTVEAGSFAAKELAAIAEVTGQFDNSALLRELPEDMRRAAAKADILRKRIFPRAPAGAIEVQGWLEAPWSNAKTLVIAGCREGALPSGTYDDAFLPDAKKEGLGLTDQKRRLARDAYLLSCILSSRPASQVRLGFSRFRKQGEPNRPSRLLFSCADSELPSRSDWLLKPAPRSERKDKNDASFKLHIPEPTAEQFPPKSIRVTAFKSYLECPLRFYLAHILKMRKFDADAREIPATDFGTVMHKVLEDFALDKSLAGLRDPDEIARKLSEILDAVSPAYYGEKPSPVVRVQIENMRARLAAAAATESIIRDEGWKTIEAEFKVTIEDNHQLGGLPVTGTIDRIDVHPEKGLRILDYKTYSQPKNPTKTHIGPLRESDHLPEAELEIRTKKGEPRPRSWTDLQLPLYAWLAKRIWPEHAAKGIEVGYFLLPPDGDLSKDSLEIFQLTDEMQASAEKCAERIAQLVKGGHFWPPAPSSQIEFDDFEDWFMQGDPQEMIDEESAHRLNCNP
ncbi:MAG: hypothetical protein FGM15_03430 [Chthoniobacterales bacterium]|nr:hypothetical protein [Chthoniobacterales bacterium]